MYLLTVKFQEDKSTLNEHVAEHTKWVKQAASDKLFVLAGPTTDSNGGVLLAVNMPREQLNELINQDPFVKYGLVGYSISHFEPTYYQKELASFVL